MNTRRIAFVLSFSALFAGASMARAETSFGTSQMRTRGGTNLVKMSIISNSQVPAAREIVTELKRYGIPTLLANGYKASLPSLLANEEQVRPWRAGEERILRARTGTAIATRLWNLIGKAERLYNKGLITNAEVSNVKSLQPLVAAFSANAYLLKKHNVSVLLDQ